MDNMNAVQGKLDEADSIKNDTSSYLNERFDESDKKLDANLKSVLKEQSEQAVFASAIHQTVLQVAQNNQLMLHNMINDLKTLEKQQREHTEKLKSGVDAAKTGLSGKSDALSTKLTSLAADIKKLPTRIPEPEKVDLSPVINGIKQVGNAVKNIPTAKFPDMSGNFNDMKKKIADLEKKLSKRVHTFDIQRDSNNNLVKSITVKTK